MNLLTASRMKLAHACARAHLHRYEQGLTTGRTSPALAFGTATHAALEAWWLSIGAGEADPLLAALMTLSRELDPFDVARLEAMVTAYDVAHRAWAQGSDTSRSIPPVARVLAVEPQFSAPLRHPDGREARTWRIAGKIDALVRLTDGRTAIIEHKTTSRDAGAGTDYRRKLTLDPQISVYFDGAEALGHPADLCIYDVLVKPSQKPLLATEAPQLRKDGTPRAGTRLADETPEEYRARLIDVIAADPGRYLIHAEVVRSEREREAHASDAWETVALIEHTRRRLPTLPPRSSSACFAFGAPCDFLALCEGRASAQDYATTTPHSELTT